ncbi:endonuclease [Vibrio wakamikoensis]|jgi:endonuclease-3 related protein|uniref:Endonuclease III domain-containing protein n=2 Tax=Vibrionaceae TaxID=641 RepID=A0AAU8BPI7_9VIBR
MSVTVMSSDEALRIRRLFSKLEQHYGWFDWWQAQEPYEVMLGAVLVQNTNWQNAQKALDNLAPYLSPECIAAMELESLAEKIRPSGYYNQKSQKIKAVSEWFSRYHYDIASVRECSLEQLRPELLSIKGVGGETADVILTYAVKKPSFVIDAYARRILSRYGHAVPSSYEAFRAQMQHVFPPDTKRYAYYHGLMVEHGKEFCRPKPNCAVCPLGNNCKKIGI